MVIAGRTCHDPMRDLAEKAERIMFPLSLSLTIIAWLLRIELLSVGRPLRRSESNLEIRTGLHADDEHDHGVAANQAETFPLMSARDGL